jgi:hypothetical protein
MPRIPQTALLFLLFISTTAFGQQCPVRTLTLEYTKRFENDPWEITEPPKDPALRKTFELHKHWHEMSIALQPITIVIFQSEHGTKFKIFNTTTLLGKDLPSHGLTKPIKADCEHIEFVTNAIETAYAPGAHKILHSITYGQHLAISEQLLGEDNSLPKTIDVNYVYRGEGEIAPGHLTQEGEDIRRAIFKTRQDAQTKQTANSPIFHKRIGIEQKLTHCVPAPCPDDDSPPPSAEPDVKPLTVDTDKGVPKPAAFERMKQNQWQITCRDGHTVTTPSGRSAGAALNPCDDYDDSGLTPH